MLELGQAVYDLIYPVGSIYMSVNSTNPGTLFGGTWVQLKDRFLLGAGDTYTNGNTGGEASHTLSKLELPDYSLAYTGVKFVGGSSGNIAYTSGGWVAEQGINLGGGGQAHNNLPPYLVVYMWKRTA